MDEIRVGVEGGTIVASPNYDPDYPGIDIEFIPDESNTVWKDVVSYPRVLMEKPRGGKLRMLLWTDCEDEEYTRNFEVQE